MLIEVECDPYCVSVLEARMLDGALPKSPIVRDVRGYFPSGAAATAEAVTLGFPCQAEA